MEFVNSIIGMGLAFGSAITLDLAMDLASLGTAVGAAGFVAVAGGGVIGLASLATAGIGAYYIYHPIISRIISIFS